MILIVTRKDDVHADLVVRHLAVIGVPFFRLNTEAAEEYEITLGATSGMMKNRISGLSLDLRDVDSVWVRRRSFIELAQNKYRPFIESEWAGLYRDIWLMLHKCFWMSWPFSMEQARGKIGQIRLAAELGFNVPATCFTNSISEAVQFQKDVGICVYKPNDGGVFDRGGNEAVYTNIIAQDLVASSEMDDMLKICPGIFQPYIEKKFELRVTVVGDRVFATRIDSQNSGKTKVDWRRYDFTNTPHSSFVLPEEESSMCVQIVKRLGLSFGAIDMIVTPKDEIYFLEINPNGQWAWIEALTGQQISAEIASLLASYVK